MQPPIVPLARPLPLISNLIIKTLAAFESFNLIFLLQFEIIRAAYWKMYVMHITAGVTFRTSLLDVMVLVNKVSGFDLQQPHGRCPAGAKG